MSVAEQSVAEAAIAEQAGGIVCELPASRWNAQQQRLADRVYKHLSEPACYVFLSGGQKTIDVIPEQSLEDLTGNVITSVGQTQYEIGMKKSAIFEPKRGDVIITASNTYRVEDIVRDNDPLQWVVTAGLLR